MGCGRSQHVRQNPSLLGRSDSGKAKPFSESEGQKLDSFVVIRVVRAELLRSHFKCRDVSVSQGWNTRASGHIVG